MCRDKYLIGVNIEKVVGPWTECHRSEVTISVSRGTSPERTNSWPNLTSDLGSRLGLPKSGPKVEKSLKKGEKPHISRTLGGQFVGDSRQLSGRPVEISIFSGFHLIFAHFHLPKGVPQQNGLRGVLTEVVKKKRIYFSERCFAHPRPVIRVHTFLSPQIDKSIYKYYFLSDVLSFRKAFYKLK